MQPLLPFSNMLWRMMVVLLLTALGETLSPTQLQPRVLLVEANSSTTSFVGSPHLLVASADSLRSFTAIRSGSAEGSYGGGDLGKLFEMMRSYLIYPFRRMGRLLRPGNPNQSEDQVVESATMAATNNSSFLQAALAKLTGSREMDKASESVHIKDPTASIAPSHQQLEQSMGVVGRSATGSVDFSGIYDMIVTDEFKKEYDRYLELMGQPFFVRSVALNVISFTEEEMVQTDKGRSLFIRGRNVKGVWERTLTASGPEKGREPEFEGVLTAIKTADDEEVLAEAWWENSGTVHRSFLYGVKKYGGGSFESIRYLEDDGNVYVCESIFHPNDKDKQAPRITWRFQRRKQ